MILVLCILLALVLVTTERVAATRPGTLSVPSDSGGTTDQRHVRRRRPPRLHGGPHEPAATPVLHATR